MRHFVIILIVTFSVSCKRQDVTIYPNADAISCKVEKVFFVDNTDLRMIYFKVRIINPTQMRLLLSDNVLWDSYRSPLAKPNGFFLKTADGEVRLLGNNDYGFIAVSPASKEAFYFGTRVPDVIQKDANVDSLRKIIEKSKICYDGAHFTFDSIKQTKYFRSKSYFNFKKNRAQYVVYTGKFILPVPADIEIKGLSKLPLNSDEWQQY